MKFYRHRSDNDREFLQQRIKLLAQAAVRLPFILLMISLIVCFALKEKVSLQRLTIWVVLFQCAAVPRAIFAKKILSNLQGRSDPERDYWIFVLFAGLTGLAAGLSAPLFFAHISAAEQAFIGMVLIGLVAGSVATSGSSPYVLAAYALSALLPLGITWTLYRNDHPQLVTWLILLFSLVMLIYARDGKLILYESFLIRRQRDDAYALLEGKNADIMLANAAVKSLAQTRTRALAAASHDLRQPLHALSICSAVLAATPTPNTLHEIGKNIDHLVISLGGLLETMLDLSQLDNQSFPVQNSQICLARTCKKIVRDFEPAIQAKNLRLETSFAPAASFCDVTILERIIRNLLDNAVKYTGNGSILITTMVSEGKATLSIADSGKGIADDQIGRIFEEFYQVDNPGRDRSQGLGLGLSIVQKMIVLIAGEIEFTSQLGIGTTVTLRLPHLRSEEITDSFE